MEKEGFHEFLYNLMMKKGLNTNSMSALLTSLGLQIDRSAIHSYIGCTRIPSFQRAKQILELLECDVSDDDLLLMLKISGEEKATEKYGSQKYLMTGIRIPYKNLTDNEMPPSKVAYILNQRIHEVSKLINGDGISAYITALIKLDIDYNVLDKYYGKDEANE